MAEHTRVFFVNVTPSTEEIFETLEECRTHTKDNQGTVRIALVRNAYRDGGDWNYDDRSDTFTYLDWFDVAKD